MKAQAAGGCACATKLMLPVHRVVVEQCTNCGLGRFGTRFIVRPGGAGVLLGDLRRRCGEGEIVRLWALRLRQEHVLQHLGGL